MAINQNDEKIGKFYQAINHYAEEQRKKIEEEVSAFKQKELDEAEVEVLAEAYHLIQKEMMQMRNNISREMAQREMEGRRALLEQRRKIMEDVFQRAADCLRTYTEKPDYVALLEKYARSLSTAFQKPGTVIRLRKEDAKYQPQIAAAFGAACSFETDDSIRIGGLRAYNTELGIMADETLDSMLDEQRGWFEENSGLTIAG
ncbi:V-type ATP synthase subunit E [Anaeromassilibacillus senegalensis]|uniref:V-type ATP synthase subunit E n=1 Tax=Anaeromassilibacillus senegalensis TaxID=1673717 RepID=UPI000682B789|nr:V-type ATP synthase subunit E [Anaeromassilibacillus senegalensis]